MIRLIAAFLLLPLVSFGQLFTQTNDILYLQPTDYPINGQLNTPIQYTVKVKINNTDFTMATGSVRWLIYDGLSGTELESYDGTYTGSIASVNYTPTFLVNGYAKMNFYRPSGELQAMISWNNYSITNPCVTCGGGGATSVTVTNLINSTNTVALNITNTASVTVTNLINSTNTASVTVTNLNTASVTVTNLINTTNINSSSITVTNLISSTNINSSSVVVTNLITSTNIISVVVTNVGGGGSGTLSGFNSATTGGVFLVVSNGWDASITNEGNIFTIYTGLPKGATGVNQVATWNGTNWIATSLGAPTPTTSVGTNVQKWSLTVFPNTNTWAAPSTQIMFTAWGAGGGGGGGGAGFAKALWVGAAGTLFDIVIGTGGGFTAGNNGPFSGSGLNGPTTNLCNGGGATYIAISGTTNIILMAGGSGGGSSTSSGFGGPGGGYWFTSLDGTTSSTNVQAGQGGWASNEYGLAATAGTNLSASITNLMQNGGYLRGGHASTNGCTSATIGALGGGGGGWYGGAGGTRTNATAGMGSSSGAGGGGGLGYANTNYVTFAQLIAGQRAVGGIPSGQDHPTYTSGRGVGGTANGNGANGCAGAMW